MTSFSNPNEFDKERMICNIMDNYQKHCEVLRSVSPELLRLYWIKSNSLVQDTMEYLESEKLRLRPTTIVHQYENHGTWKKKSICFPCYTERIKISLLYMYQLNFVTNYLKPFKLVLSNPMLGQVGSRPQRWKMGWSQKGLKFGFNPILIILI